MPATWVARPRFHHQYLPDQIQHEPEAFSAEERRRLEAKGHQLHEIRDGYDNMQAIYWDRLQNQVWAASDPRGIGKAEVRFRVVPLDNFMIYKDIIRLDRPD